MDEWNQFVKTGRIDDYIRYFDANERKKEQVKKHNGDKDGRDCDKGELHR